MRNDEARFVQLTRHEMSLIVSFLKAYTTDQCCTREDCVNTVGTRILKRLEEKFECKAYVTQHGDRNIAKVIFNSEDQYLSGGTEHEL